MPPGAANGDDGIPDENFLTVEFQNVLHVNDVTAVNTQEVVLRQLGEEIFETDALECLLMIGKKYPAVGLPDRKPPKPGSFTGTSNRS